MPQKYSHDFTLAPSSFTCTCFCCVLQEIPNYEARRTLLARDPWACACGFQVLAGLALRHISGLRFCPGCPHCVRSKQPYADTFGSYAAARGGVFDRIDAVFGSLECQKRGSFHLHGHFFANDMQFQVVRPVAERIMVEFGLKSADSALQGAVAQEPLKCLLPTNDLRPSVVYIKFHAAKWQLEGIDEPGVYLVVPQCKAWYLDKSRKFSLLKVSRTQLPLAPTYAMTVHSSHGKTLTAVLLDLHVDKRVDPTISTVAATRVRSQEDVFILRPMKDCQLPERSP